MKKGKQKPSKAMQVARASHASRRCQVGSHDVKPELRSQRNTTTTAPANEAPRPPPAQLEDRGSGSPSPESPLVLRTKKKALPEKKKKDRARTRTPLHEDHKGWGRSEGKNENSLERINPCLPLASQLHADLDALVNVFGAALVVDPELEDVAVFDLVGAAVRAVRINKLKEGKMEVKEEGRARTEGKGTEGSSADHARWM
jgi:hypothetical protein